MKKTHQGMMAQAPGSGSRRPKRILIVDDHPLTRAGLGMVLKNHGQYVVCAEAADHHEALQRIGETKPDLATVDLTLRNSHGLELIKDIRVHYPALLILVISMDDEFLNAQRAIRAGAQGYMTKMEALSEVIGAFECIFSGEIYVSQQVTSKITAKMMRSDRIDGAPTIQSLTDRELQIFGMIGDGLCVRQIAEQLNLGRSTVETYRNRIREKLSKKAGSELLQAAIHWNRTGRGDIKTGAPQAQTAIKPHTGNAVI